MEQNKSGTAWVHYSFLFGPHGPLAAFLRAVQHMLMVGSHGKWIYDRVGGQVKWGFDDEMLYQIINHLDPNSALDRTGLGRHEREDFGQCHGFTISVIIENTEGIGLSFCS